MMTTGDRIRQARINNRLTQDKLAALLRVSRVTISSWENGQNTPTVENIALITRILRTSADYLITGQTTADQPTPPQNPDDALCLSLFKSLPPTARAEVINYLRYQTWLQDTNQ